MMKKDGELIVFHAHSKLSGPPKDQIYDHVFIANASVNWANKSFYTSDLITFPESSSH